MAAAAALVDAILESDRKAPRKQRHTARGSSIGSTRRGCVTYLQICL
jgi:hypothetical protein